jgi:hypothetical protein
MWQVWDGEGERSTEKALKSVLRTIPGKTYASRGCTISIGFLLFL